MSKGPRDAGTRAVMTDEPPASARPDRPGATSLERELARMHAESFGWALACCRYDHEAASDVLQTAYVKVLDRKARFQGRSSLKTWFFAVVRMTAADRRRRNWVRALGFKRYFARLEAADVPPQPLELVERSERRQRLVAALRALPKRQREVLELVFYQGLTIEEAAGVMAVSVGTARVHYERGKKRMLALVMTAAAALALAVWLRSRPGPARSPVQLARATAVPPDANVARIEQIASFLDRWRAPTDFLLDTPRMDLLTGTPNLDFTTFTFADWHQNEEKKL